MKKEEIVKALLEFRKMCVYLPHNNKAKAVWNS